jgi:hypothetical protein
MRMDANDILGRLSKISDGDGSWAEVGALVSELDAIPSGRDIIGWRERAAEAVGYSIETLRQMQKAHAFVDGLARFLPAPDLNKIRRWTLGHVELLSRMAKLDRDKVLEICRRDEPPSIRKLRHEYHVLRDLPDTKLVGITAGHRASRAFHIAVKGVLPIVFPEARFTKWPGDFRYASPDVLISSRLPGSIEAVCWLRSVTDRAKFYRFVQTAMAEHSFFDRYWWVVPRESLPFFDRERTRLALPNVGIVSFDLASAMASVHVEPTRGPVPDRTAMTRDFLKQRMPGAERQPHSLDEESEPPGTTHAVAAVMGP